MVGWLAVLLLAQFALGLNAREPYPSIFMPGFTGIDEISSPDQIARTELQLTVDGETHVVGYSDLFHGAPVGQQRVMFGNLERLEGSEDEWTFFDQAAQRLGYGDRVTVAELVRRFGSGAELSVLRIERISP